MIPNLLTPDQNREAVEKVKELCDAKMDGYHMVSLRSALRELGYAKAAQDQVIRWVAYRGFTYCLDPIITSTWWDSNNNKEVAEYPDWQVCYWGPDQLKSRLNSVT